MNILFLDHGINLELARLLGKAGHMVFYHVSSQDKHSRHDIHLIGRGFEKEGVRKTESYLGLGELVDRIIAPDCYDGQEVDYYRKQGKSVWGASYAATQLELDRWYAVKEEQKAGLASAGHAHVVGVTNLIKILSDPKMTNIYVKCSGFREVETFRHVDWTSTQEQFVAPLLTAYGADEELEFLLTTPVDPAVEVGADNIVLGGMITTLTPYGYEDKDTSYLGRLNGKLPECLKKINQCLIPHLAGCFTFFSTEARVTPSGEAYLIDLTLRAAHPPTAGLMVGLANLAEVITCDIEPRALTYANYVAVLVGESAWAEEHPTEIKFPEELRRYVKFAKAHNRNGRIFTVPSTAYPVQVVGTGPTAKMAAEMCRLHAEKVKGKDLTFDFSSFDKLLNKTIPEGRKYGIDF